MRLTGLPAIARSDARVLVLGSMPGGQSLKLGQYYANPGNRFWRVLAALLGFDPAASYEVRTERVMASGLALWDVLGECRRAGSLDAAIEKGSEVPNDFPSFLRSHPRIEAIGLNGAAAAGAFRRLVLPQVAWTCAVLDLPSTSGANAACRLDALVGRWAELVAHAKLDGAPPAQTD